jgi:hypothetical protein
MTLEASKCGLYIATKVVSSVMPWEQIPYIGIVMTLPFLRDPIYSLLPCSHWCVRFAIAIDS